LLIFDTNWKFRVLKTTLDSVIHLMDSQNSLKAAVVHYRARLQINISRRKRHMGRIFENSTDGPSTFSPSGARKMMCGNT
jgi:hypothetical protein